MNIHRLVTVRRQYFDFECLWAKRVAKSEVSFECFFVCAIISLVNKDSQKTSTHSVDRQSLTHHEACCISCLLT